MEDILFILTDSTITKGESWKMLYFRADRILNELGFLKRMREKISSLNCFGEQNVKKRKIQETVMLDVFQPEGTGKTTPRPA